MRFLQGMMKKPTIASHLEKHWTALLVDGRGRIRRIPHFRRKLWIIAGLTGGAIILALIMGFLYAGTLYRHRTLTNELEMLQDKLVAMRQENELLRARAVRLETQAAHPAIGDARESAPVPAPASGSDRQPVSESPAADAPSPPGVRPDQAPDTASEKDPAASGAEPMATPQVDAQDLTLDYRPDSATIEARIVVRNTGQVPVGGRVVIVLHTEEGPSRTYLALPDVPIKDGRPIGNEGRRFSINHFMTLTLARKFAEAGTRFSGAVVYAYAPEGDQLLKKAFDVSLQIPAPKLAPVPAPVTAPLGLNLPAPEPDPEESPGDQP